MMKIVGAGAVTATTILDRKQAALTGLFIGDAVAMPVHWMYDTR